MPAPGSGIASNKEAFFANVTVTDAGCWEWRGRKNNRGYAVVSVNNSDAKAHRHAWTLANGRSVPDGMFVLHKCDNPPCINPGHLFIGSHADNMRDAVRKGRAAVCQGEGHPAARLTNAQVREIRRRYIPYKNSRQLAREFGVSLSYVSALVKRAAVVRVSA